MKKLSRVFIVLAALALFATACGSSDSGTIEVQDARYRLSRSDLGAGYMTVVNSTDDAVTLEAVTAPGVGRIELHESLAGDDGTMSMEPRPDGFVVEPGAELTLAPGGKHLMIFDPEGTGDLTLALDFGDETLEVVATYDAEASAAAMSDDSMGDMDHSNMEGMDDDSMDSMEEDG